MVAIRAALLQRASVTRLGRLAPLAAVVARPRSAPVFFFALVLFGYAHAHIDDFDALYYRELARAAFASGDLFDLRWSQLPDTRFVDHLPPGIWLVGLLEALLGERGSRLAYAAMSFATFVVLARLMTLLGAAHLRGWMFVLVATSEAFVRVLTQQRLDPPFVLLWVLAVTAAVRLSTRHAWIVAGLLTGLSALLRPPQALALLVLIPAALLVRRRNAEQPLLVRDDLLFGAVFLLLASMPLAAFQLADSWNGDGSAIGTYLRVQVLSSLYGGRPDGAPSHAAPLLRLLSHFWPGMVGLVLAVGALMRGLRLPPQLRRGAPLGVWFAMFWAACVLTALSLGKRHIWMHSWPAYPALFVIAAFGCSEASAAWWEHVDASHTRLALALQRLRRAWLRHAVKVAVLAGGAWAVLIVAFADLDCDVVALKKQLHVQPKQKWCEKVVVISKDGTPDWGIAHRLVDHLRVSLTFASVVDAAVVDAAVADAARVPHEASCAQLVVGARQSVVPASLGAPWLVGRRHSVWVVK